MHHDTHEAAVKPVALLVHRTILSSPHAVQICL